MADTRVLRTFSLFKEAQEETLRELALASHTERREEGHALWREGGHASSAVLIREGLVQVVRRGVGGADATIALFGPREVVGLTAALEGGRYPADAVAASREVEVVRVPAEALRRALERDAGVARAVTWSLLEHTRALRAKIDVLTAGEVPQRLATLFLHLVERFGDETEEGTTLLPLHLSRAMLARLVGARVETVIRVMRRWEKEGLMSTEAQGFVLPEPARLPSLSPP